MQSLQAPQSNGTLATIRSFDLAGAANPKEFLHGFDHGVRQWTPNPRRFHPRYVGFCIKGARHLFNQIGIPLELAKLIERIINYKPGSAMAELLRIIFNDYEAAGDLQINLANAAQVACYSLLHPADYPAPGLDCRRHASRETVIVPAW
jgi:hypothetical protein